jgi:hypothetical protein
VSFICDSMFESSYSVLELELLGFIVFRGCRLLLLLLLRGYGIGILLGFGIVNSLGLREEISFIMHYLA